MAKCKTGITVIDLFCGGGGFSQGFHMAGFDVVFGIDFWRPACETHEHNGLGETRKLDLLEFDVDRVLELKGELEAKHGTIDIIIGSPPCTEFSMAKKAGHGDLEKGMLLVRKHLLFVTLFKPKYWLMENVPRLGEVLPKECDAAENGGWRISYERIGIPRERWQELGLEGDSLLIPHGQVFVATDYGTCENRKRFIAGSFPLELMDDIKVPKDVSISGLLKRFGDSVKAAGKSGKVEDPNYSGHFVKRKDLRDHDYDTTVHPMYWEEMRHLKRRHIQYGRMSLPEDPTAPARTIMATSNSSSRESLLFETDAKVIYQGRERKVYRQPTVREVACIQGFPVDFQLVAAKMDDRYKLIGNAVPCQVSYALARCIAKGIENGLEGTKDRGYATRAKETLDRQQRDEGRPILRSPKDIVPEADDIGEMHSEFRAKATKNLRRKLLSSKLENDSCVVIFENGAVVDDKVKGGTEWKVCMQMGMGTKYHRVFFDEVSVARILKVLDAPLDREEIRETLRDLVEAIDLGIPVLTDGWVEYPGLNGKVQEYLEYVTEVRLRLPSVSLLQRTFTEDLAELDGMVGAIDLFDGLDAITLSVFGRKERKGQRNRMVRITSLKDNGRYPHRLDPRIVPTIDSAEIPLVTLLTGLMCVHVLRNMYDLDPKACGLNYYRSVVEADNIIVGWTKRAA